METKMNFLGSEVKDKITDFKGIVVAENHKITGSEIMLLIQSKLLKDNIPIEQQWLSSYRAETVKPNEKILSMIHNIVLGETATDPLTGFQGVVIEMTFWLYECIRVEIQATKLKDGLPLKAKWFDEAQIKSITKRKKEKRPPGGPARMDSPRIKTGLNS